MIRVLRLCTAVGLWPVYAIFIAPVWRVSYAVCYVLDHDTLPWEARS